MLNQRLELEFFVSLQRKHSKIYGHEKINSPRGFLKKAFHSFSHIFKLFPQDRTGRNYKECRKQNLMNRYTELYWASNSPPDLQISSYPSPPSWIYCSSRAKMWSCQSINRRRENPRNWKKLPVKWCYPGKSWSTQNSVKVTWIHEN